MIIKKSFIKVVSVICILMLLAGIVGLRAGHSDKMLTPEQIKPDDLGCGG